MVIPATETSSPQQPRLLTRTGPGIALGAYHYVISPSEDVQQWYEHPGEDVVYVISGSIVVEFADGREFALDPGDALHHDGDVGHRWRLRGDEPAEAVIVLTVPE